MYYVEDEGYDDSPINPNVDSDYTVSVIPELSLIAAILGRAVMDLNASDSLDVRVAIAWFEAEQLPKGMRLRGFSFADCAEFLRISLFQHQLIRDMIQEAKERLIEKQLAASVLQIDQPPKYSRKKKQHET